MKKKLSSKSMLQAPMYNSFKSLYYITEIYGEDVAIKNDAIHSQVTAAEAVQSESF